MSKIEDVKSFLEESFGTTNSEHSTHNSLVWNVRSPLEEAEILENFSPRFVVDRLVSQYFNSASPALCESAEHNYALH